MAINIGTDRYRGRELSTGSIVIFDVDNDDAWIQSDTTVDRALLV